MKYTSLLCAAVVATALGAFARDGATNLVVSATFDGADLGDMTNVNVRTSLANLPNGGQWGWTNNDSEDDTSCIIQAPISETAAVAGYAGKSLLLNTNGKELSVSAGTQPSTKSEIKMKIRLVASDTPPTVAETDVHAAVYLQENEENPSANGLYALSYDEIGETNLWVALTAVPPDTFEVANGDMIALKVVMDYEQTEASYSALNLGDNPDQEVDDGDYIDLGTVNMANSTNNQDPHLQSVAFKGTGSVDDLFISSIEQIATTASIKFDLYVDGIREQGLNNERTDTIDLENWNDPVGFEDPQADSFGEGYVILSVDVWDDANASAPIAQLDPDDLYDGQSDYLIDRNDVTLVAGHSYTVKVMVGPEQVAPSAYKGPSSGKIQILCADDEDAYEDATDEDFVPLSFTSISFVTDEVSGDVSIVAGFDATVIVDGELPVTETFGVLTSTSLTAVPTPVAGSVTVTATGCTVTIPMPAGDALFIKGFTEAPAPAGD